MDRTNVPSAAAFSFWKALPCRSSAATELDRKDRMAAQRPERHYGGVGRLAGPGSGERGVPGDAAKTVRPIEWRLLVALPLQWVRPEPAPHRGTSLGWETRLRRDRRDTGRSTR